MRKFLPAVVIGLSLSATMAEAAQVEFRFISEPAIASSYPFWDPIDE